MQLFLSYTRNKDQFSTVSHFRKRLESELDMREPCSRVFQDKEHIQEGHHFPEVLAEELKRSDALLVLVSPAWLKSEWCRREFNLFTDELSSTSRLHRILPVLWVDTPQLSHESSDPISRALANINYADWRDLRYESWSSPANQKQVGALAQRSLALLVPEAAADVVFHVPELQKHDSQHAIQNLREHHKEGRPPATRERKALEALLAAKTRTLIYLGRLDRGESEDRTHEETLARLWSDAAHAFVGVNPPLARLLDVKSDSWARPRGWDDERVKEAGIAIEAIAEMANEILGRKAGA